MISSAEQKIYSALQPFVPEKTLPLFVQWISDYKIKVLVKPNRKTVMGDYRSPDFARGHVISVNGTLNQFDFALTFVHEVAHLVVWLEHRGRVDAHGAEWKNSFRQLMQPLLQQEIFPADISEALQRYLINPASSSCYDLLLTKTLARYNKKQTLHLEDIAEGKEFIAHDGKKYVKGKRLRKRYACVNVMSRQVYLFSPVAPVKVEE